MDPDPRSPKTCGSGSATLLQAAAAAGPSERGAVAAVLGPGGPGGGQPGLSRLAGGLHSAAADIGYQIRCTLLV